jgi:hypothetical protein
VLEPQPLALILSSAGNVNMSLLLLLLMHPKCVQYAYLSKLCLQFVKHGLLSYAPLQ